MLDDQTGAFDLMLESQNRQLRVQLSDGIPNKLHAPVLSWQDVQNLAVINKHTVHQLAAFQGVVQGSVVKSPQVTAKPHQANRVFFFHDADGIEFGL